MTRGASKSNKTLNVMKSIFFFIFLYHNQDYLKIKE